jgi:hypothetical protein
MRGRLVALPRVRQGLPEALLVPGQRYVRAGAFGRQDLVCPRLKGYILIALTGAIGIPAGICWLRVPGVSASGTQSNKSSALFFSKCFRLYPYIFFFI